MNLYSTGWRKKILVWILIINMPAINFCGSSGETINESANYNSINTAKLVGTPFEGLTSGADIDPYLFLCGEYRTDSINEFPIPVFVALSQGAIESAVQEGIEIANAALGFTAYQYTDVWSDASRLIYQVSELTAGAIGQTYGVTYSFDGTFATIQNTDWVIGITTNSANIVAHELGHATGINRHTLIDYENNIETELEEGSIMEPDGGFGHLNDYNFMMNVQGQIMLDHLGQIGMTDDSSCN